MRTRIVRLKHTLDMEIDATLDVFTAKPLVIIYQATADFREDVALRPVEAERLAAALIAAAKSARRKVL